MLSQYATHREKMRQIGREEDLEKINRIALKIAREVADDTNTLMAGGVCNTNLYVKGNKETEDKIRAIFDEQVCTAEVWFCSTAEVCSAAEVCS